MRRLLAASLAALSLTVAVTVAGTARAADADPSMHQIYEAAAGGHLDQAQTMIEQVLRDHPKSAKAHYVQAELFAREGKVGLARAELKQAEELEPGLPFVKPQSLAELKAQLGLGGVVRTLQPQRVIVGAAPAPHFPWGTLIVLAGAIGLLWLLFRRRQPVVYSAAPSVGPGPYGPAGYGGGVPYGAPPAGPGAPGLGSTIAGGLASGLAVGAGVVAGEELAHHFLDGDRREAGVVPGPAVQDADWRTDANSDMGGADFGVNDPGSWDDGGGFSGGGGGDDWS